MLLYSWVGWEVSMAGFKSNGWLLMCNVVVEMRWYKKLPRWT